MGHYCYWTQWGRVRTQTECALLQVVYALTANSPLHSRVVYSETLLLPTDALTRPYLTGFGFRLSSEEPRRNNVTHVSVRSGASWTYGYWHDALTAENKHRRGPADPRTRCVTHADAGNQRPVRGHLLGVGPVPEDGVAVGHHFGVGLLAKNTHQQHQADKDDHFHLQHHYSETSARIPPQP